MHAPNVAAASHTRATERKGSAEAKCLHVRGGELDCFGGGLVREARPPMPPSPDFRVAPSKIHGYGLFAGRDFAEGEPVLVVDGVVRRAEEVAHELHCLWLDDQHELDMVDQSRWVNHACDPNLRIERSSVDGAVRVRMIARRGIAAGEELSFDYSFAREDAVPCTCGGAGCVGWIVDRDDPRGPPTGDEELAARVAALQTHPNVEWRFVPGKGRGVFARRPLAKGSVIEVAPVTHFPERHVPTDSYDDNPIKHYIFSMENGPGRENGLCWGLLSLYNHSPDPNMELLDGPVPETFAAVALRDIARGEEICFDYGFTWFPVA